MKRVTLCFVLCILSLCLFAQNEVTKFLGIPVDGYKAEMITKLKEKGFVSSRYDREILEGEFNGEDVMIHIVTNNNKVWRICVFDKYTRDESQIRLRFNRLCEQFQNNKKYTKPLSIDYAFEISEEEDIRYQISVNKKQYSAEFYQKVDSVYFVNKYPDLIKFSSKYRKDLLDVNNISEADEINLLDLYQEMSNKMVWFRISEYYGEYRILMYYDNLYNRSNGEDL